jgi:hypothetical protein
MQYALVQISDYVVVNIIIAVPSYVPPEGYLAIELTPGQVCNVGWIYDPATGTFINPNPPPQEE